MAGRGKPSEFASRAARHCAASSPGVVCHSCWVGQPAHAVFPQSISCDATCAIWGGLVVSESNTLLLGSITAMTTTTAAMSCIPSGAAWQQITGGVGVAFGVQVGVGVGAGVWVGFGGHEQIRVSHGVSLRIEG